MDFQELLNHADYNAAEEQYKGTVKRYSSKLPPPKKLPKANVQSENIRRFLEKKKAEEEAKVAEARREKEKLLALRAQNSKNNKKAKIMASRTKDNDFSKIKLTDDELEAKKRIETALLKKKLADKVERMKARIEMEEREKLLPKKRKRKSKNANQANIPDTHDDDDDDDELLNGSEQSNASIKNNNNDNQQKDKFKKPKPPPPVMSFTDLLKIAQQRQEKPMEIAVKKKEEEKLMTKKERKLMEEELARKKRKEERLLRGESGLPKTSNSSQAATVSKKNPSDRENLLIEKDSKKPVVIHVGKDVSKAEEAKFKIPKSTVNTTNKNGLVKQKDAISNISAKSSNLPNIPQKPVSSSPLNGQKKVTKPGDNNGSKLKNSEVEKKVLVPKKNGLKTNPIKNTPPKQPVQDPKFDEEAIKAKIEKEIREKLEKELEDRIMAKFAALQNSQPKVTETKSEVPKQVKKEPIERSNSKKAVEKASSGVYKKDMEKMIAMRKQAMEKSSLKPKLPEKKPFHKNPYLDPPRRLLEPQRPPRPPMKRRIESDDDDDDDDDMSDFIDDGPSQNDLDYSKYIKEIFNYDRSKYVDCDDDDIVETSFAEQMKEEVRSARLGYLEDLEEEKLEMERLKRKKKKK